MVSTFTGNPISGHCLWTTIYKYINVILDGLQGLMVSIAFCYRNGEVCFHSNLLKDKYCKIIKLQKMSLTIKTNSIIQKKLHNCLLFQIRNLLRTSWKRFRENFSPQDHGTNMQLSEFPRGSETCFTQVPQPKIENNHHHDETVTR
jgi:hypothetical protein